METIAFYRDRETGAHPIFDSEVRRRELNTLFGTPLAPEDWDTLGVDPVYVTERREHDTSTHSVREGEIAQMDGVWRQTWIVEKLPPPPPPPPIVIPADALFVERMTDEEYDALDESIRAGETARVYRGWAAATSFAEGTALWTLLDKHLSLVVTAERKVELLARPNEVAAFADDAMAA